MISIQALLDSISPSKVGSNEVVLASVEDRQKLGIRVLRDQPCKLLQNIKVPEESGLDDINCIGKVF